MRKNQRLQHKYQLPAIESSLEKDPVCGMTVSTSTTRENSQYNGNKFYFCGQKCKKKFDSNPDEYIIAMADKNPIKDSSSIGSSSPQTQ